MTAPPPDGGASFPLSDDAVPQVGELKIKERRSWKTWQLLSVALVAAIIGMWINGDTGGGSSAASSNPDGSHLPAEGAGAPAASSHHDNDGRRGQLGHDDDHSRRGQLGHHDHGRRRGHDDHRRRRVHHRDHGGGGGRWWCGTRAPALAAAKGELDQHRVHHDDRPVEHRLGLQLRPGAGFGSLVPGVRDTVPVVGVSDGHGRHQRDRRVRAVGHARNPAWGRRSSWCRRPRRARGSSR